MRLLVTNIKTLAGIADEGVLRLRGAEMKSLGTLSDAWLLIENGKFSAFGRMQDIPSCGFNADEEVNAQGGTVLPSWCDPHTHIVYAGSRQRVVLHGDGKSTHCGQLVNVDFWLQAPPRGGFEYAVGVLGREKTFVAEHVYVVGQPLAAHLGQHL